MMNSLLVAATLAFSSIHVLRHAGAAHSADQFEYVAKVGRRIALPCRTSIDKPVDYGFQADSDAEIMEIANGGQLVNGHRVRYAVEHSGPNAYQLIIFKASLDDTGIYRCTEDSGNGDLHLINLKVTESDSETNTNPAVKTIVADIGSPVILPCRSHRTEGVDWSFMSPSAGDQLHICQNGRIIDDLASKYALNTDVKGDFNLLIHEVSSSDAGTYTCVEDAGGGPHHVMKLVVLNTDRIESQVAVVGSTAYFVCQLANTHEMIRWSYYESGSKERAVIYNGRNVVGNSERLLVYTNVSRSAVSVLLINNVEYGDAGKYVCHPHTSALISQTFELHVQGSVESQAAASSETQYLKRIVVTCAALFFAFGFIVGISVGVVASNGIVAKWHAWRLCKKSNTNGCTYDNNENTCMLESSPNTNGPNEEPDMESIRAFREEVCKDREFSRSDPFICQLTQEPRMFEKCVNKLVDHLASLETKPDAIVGVHGGDSAGSVLAAVICERLKLPLILIHKNYVAATNDTHFQSRNKKDMGMRVELRAERAEDIRNVVVVDTEIVTGRSLQAAVEELGAHKLHVLECTVLSDVLSPESESRANIKANIFPVL